ncbi:heavy metal-associated domain-containing protein [Cytophaga sp. FL35]|uniref:heavy-metal-associated domain-containing protein n=1 Tax=Cytophaga sp. FL35 TaxID=1904456 RepID=UPI001653A3C3|nr:heavy metal-associated domain-containing protein [Cytophaga sp. FL35]MBC6996984.1 heavy-metal-associated domain-containing protein [Cytophaga sp. FL35]
MKTSIIIQNLKCGGCAKTIYTHLEKLKSLSDIEVEIEPSKVSFNYNDMESALEAKRILKSLGYPSITDRNSMVDKTKSFISCASGKIS